MSKKLKKKLEKSAKIQEEKQAGEGTKVFMRFQQHQYFNDLNTPLFEAGKIYELVGAAWIQRWMKRGGEIVEKKDSEKVEKPAEQNPIPTVESASEKEEENSTDPGESEELKETEEEELEEDLE